MRRVASHIIPSRGPTRVVGGVMLALVLSTAALVVWLGLRHAVADQQEDLENLSAALTAETERSVQAVDIVLGQLAGRLQAEAAGEADGEAAGLPASAASRPTHDALVDAMRNLPQVDGLIVLSETGDFVNSSRSWPASAVNAADRSYFKDLRDHRSDTVLVSEPFVSRVTGEPTFLIARRVEGAGGRFAGVVGAAVVVDHLVSFYRTVWSPPGGAVALTRPDGAVVANFPALPEAAHHSLAGAPVYWAALAASPRATVGIGPFDGRTYAMSSRRLSGSPLILSVLLDREAALATWRFHTGLIVAGALLAGLSILGSLAQLDRQFARVQASEGALAQRNAELEDISARLEEQAGLMVHTAERLHASEAELRASTEQLSRARDDAEAANRTKTAFLANMSHEIRTPLNGILGMNRLLQDSPLDADQRAHAALVQESAEALLSVINDILDVSKLEAGRMELETLPFDPRGLASGVVSLLAPQVSQKPVTLGMEVAPQVPTMLLGDPTRLRQVLLNLASNAIKFTHSGSVVLRIDAAADAGSGWRIRYAVTDTGVGIPAELHAKVFEKFAQADGTVTRRYGGTGLGLAICRELAQLMHGTIGLDSAPGQGSTFWLDVRQDAAAETLPAAPHAEPPGRSAFRALHVLLAEDNRINQQVASAMLRKRGHSVEIVGDGAAAVAAARAGGFDAVLMDVQMPGTDGLEATRQIRALSPPLGTVPIVALTANAMQGAREVYLAAGMDDYLTKPLDPEALMTTLAAVTEGRPQAALPAALAAASLDQIADLLSPAELDAFVDLCLTQTAERTGRIGDLAARGDVAAVGREAHAIAGSAAQIGATALAAIAREIEDACANDAAADALPPLAGRLAAAARATSASLRTWHDGLVADAA